MNGAETLVRTLLASGVNTCFANPGTSEMHFVAALDRVPGMHCVLCLFEGVATGAADGYGRMAEKPAITLLHGGPGLGNGVANLHNARRAQTPVLNVVGDQATHHRPLDPPLTADTEGWARGLSAWTRVVQSVSTIGADAAAAVQAARTAHGQIATLIAPADTCWDDGGIEGTPLPVPPAGQVAPHVVRQIAQVLRSGEPAVLILGGAPIRATMVADAHRGRDRREAHRGAVQRTGGARPRAPSDPAPALRHRPGDGGDGQRAAHRVDRHHGAGGAVRLSGQAGLPRA